MGREPADASKETGRIEAFSDGVFAIAITLLVLDIHVPLDLPAKTTLADALGAQWPIYVAFLISFAFIGIMWINHHRLFTHIQRADNWLLVCNLLLLLGVTIVPFPTEMMAAYLGGAGTDAQTAALVYNGLFVLIAVFFNLLWGYAAHDNRLLDPRADRRAVAAITRQYRFGPVLYGLVFLMAFVSVPLSLACSFLLALFFALPGRAIPLTGAGIDDIGGA